MTQGEKLFLGAGALVAAGALIYALQGTPTSPNALGPPAGRYIVPKIGTRLRATIGVKAGGMAALISELQRKGVGVTVDNAVTDSDGTMHVAATVRTLPSSSFLISVPVELAPGITLSADSTVETFIRT